MRRWKKVLIGVLAVLSVPAAAITARAGIADQHTRAMTSIADRVRLHPGWVLHDEVITAGGWGCISYDVPCDSMHRWYETPDRFTEADLKAIVADSGLPLAADGECIARSNGSQALCNATGTVDGFRVKLMVYVATNDGPQSFMVQLEKDG